MVYRLYIDEVGNDDIGNVHDHRHRFLSLTGVAMNLDYVREHASPRMDALKADIFKHDPDSPVILHRKDIMNKRGIFGALNDDELRERFDTALMQYLKDTDYTVITVVMDKKGMLDIDYWVEKQPYHYLMRILVEKYVQWLERQGGTGDLMPEKRRGKKDTALQNAFLRVRERGSDFVASDRIRSALPAKSLKFREKRDNVTGLQICDLVAHPSHIYVRTLQNHEVELGPFAQKIIPILREEKYDRSYVGRISGYGIKYLP